LEVAGFSARVLDVQKKGGIWTHVVSGIPSEDAATLVGQSANLRVDTSERRHTMRHHTATHLLHAALRERLGEHVSQAGSLVSPDVLRFDFTHGKGMTPEEIRDVEDRVNQMVMQAYPVVIYPGVAIDEARQMGAMALFGEKYGDVVRVVQIGGMGPQESSPSRELCGGIHVGNTGEIGLFRIVHEGSAAGGVRRITALCGVKALNSLRETEALVEDTAKALKTNASGLLGAVERLQDSLKEEKRKRERMMADAGSSGSEEAVGSVMWRSETLSEAGPDDAKLVADRLVEGRPNAVAFVVSINEGRVILVAKVGADALNAGAHAGNLVKAAAPVVGGGGGGRAEFATAGGKDASQVAAVVQTALATLRQQVGA
jgi:alanyl-tRNA synthetase